METYVPFCGTPPLPDDLWSRWTFDPVLLAALALLAAALAWKTTDRRLAIAGWTLTALLFISPICAASMALFSARVTQHVLLILIAAPLLARALPHRAWPVLPVAALFAVVFWVWHLPAPYAATLQSDLTYWAMHLSTLGGAVLLWSALFAALDDAPGQVVLGLAVTAGQMTLLSALLVFARNPWHDWHLLTTLPYGISPLADQQLAGAVMWTGGGALMLLGVAGLSARFFRNAAH